MRSVVAAGSKFIIPANSNGPVARITTIPPTNDAPMPPCSASLFHRTEFPIGASADPPREKRRRCPFLQSCGGFDLPGYAACPAQTVKEHADSDQPATFWRPRRSQQVACWRVAARCVGWREGAELGPACPTRVARVHDGTTDADSEQCDDGQSRRLRLPQCGINDVRLHTEQERCECGKTDDSEHSPAGATHPHTGRGYCHDSPGTGQGPIALK